MFLLKGLHPDFLTPRHSLWLWWRNSSLEVPETYRGETELSGFRVGAGGTATSELALSPFPVQPAGGCNFSCVESSPDMPNLNPYWPGELH